MRQFQSLSHERDDAPNHATDQQIVDPLPIVQLVAATIVYTIESSVSSRHCSGSGFLPRRYHREAIETERDQPRPSPVSPLWQPRAHYWAPGAARKHMPRACKAIEPRRSSRRGNKRWMQCNTLLAGWDCALTHSLLEHGWSAITVPRSRYRFAANRLVAEMKPKMRAGPLTRVHILCRPIGNAAPELGTITITVSAKPPPMMLIDRRGAKLLVHDRSLPESDAVRQAACSYRLSSIAYDRKQ